ncbi:uncharacterized protein PAC_02605 [Phialocephala subalpina]|uniref:Uncharacterized protein n=1 Tax=Phialocephala subalpina TaxID=576137 RepID=A0A1L7WJ12_9HELO|nr:uncharacterized protein PAC_02605 [Phialocephala subalpina]
MLDPICIPINLDAFVLNKPVVDTTGNKVLIAPITQPDYVGLRLDNSVIQHDVLPPVDLHSSRPASVNPRISQAYSAQLNPVFIKDPKPDFASSDNAIIQSRLGVYLHWSLPRGYRTGSSGADGAQRSDPDDSTKPPANATAPNPTFRLVPNRWLVVRVLKKHLPPEANPPPVDAWIIESDRLQKVEDLPGDIDLETEVTPFLAYDSNPDPTVTGNLLHAQAEKYIGYRSPSLIKQAYSEMTVPRVPLSVMNSSNPVFADYTIHNPNVFSMKDNFEYDTGKYLTYALCDYIVVGWHSSSGDSPFGDNGLKGILSGRVENFFCKLAADASTTVQGSRDKLPALSHGTIYSVEYNANARPNTDADNYVENFGKGVAMEPVAVGATPLDSVLTFLHAHRDDKTDGENILGGIPSDTAKTLLDMAELLHATADDYDSRVKAADLISGQSFRTALGGFAWHYDKKKTSNGPPQSPDRIKKDSAGKTELDYLNDLNRLQQQLDITDRMLATKRWELFAEFFKYCSDVNNAKSQTRYFDDMKVLFGVETLPGGANIVPNGPKSMIQSLLDTKKTLTDSIKSIANEDTPSLSKIPVKKVAADVFRQRTDPTLLLAGIDAGWPAAFLDYLQIRLGGEVKASSTPEVTQIMNNLNVPPTSGTIKVTIELLLNEARGAAGSTQLGFKTWSGQPFCPIFVEWEAVFYNIDASQWAVALGSSPMSNNNQSQVRYINPNPLHEPAKLSDQDTRAVSGRILVLPQPSFTLAAIVKQVLDVAGVNVPEKLQQEVTASDGTKSLNGKLDQDKLADFVKKVEGLKFISGDLMGFTDSLLTLGTGSHVKPNVREQGQSIKVLGEAKDTIKKIGFSDALAEQMIIQMGSETARTPFGTLEDFEGSSFQPFKGVQHGQLAITKITIVDKFGQAISWPLPQRKSRVPPPMPDFAIHPCIADQLCPTVLPDNTLNTVFPTADKFTSSGMVLSPFIQITPAINQTSRINAHFLRKDLDASGKLQSPPWTICNDWDNPIIGWIVVNYPDSSLQFFTGDGIFYTSLRFGGPLGTVTGIQWAPFSSPPPSVASTLVSQQLVDLIHQMQGDPLDTTKTETAQEYLRAMWGMINGAIGNMPFPPSQYSAYANAIVGKPLALVNVGWSLELAESPFKHQHTLGSQPPAGYEESVIGQYKFPVKIGDKERPFDGVVCYWDTDDNTPTSTATTTFSKIYTYPYPVTSTTSNDPNIPDPRTMIEPDTFPTLTPYFIDPTTVDETKGLLKAKAEKLLVKTLLIDPYTPLHLYSGILPIKSLQLPGWSLEAAMKNMTAFFTLGPLLITKDVPKEYNSAAPLQADSWIKDQDSNAVTDPTKKEDAFPIKLPIAGGKGMWNWLQPYLDPTPPLPGETKRPLYNALEVGQEPGTLRDDPAPYTFVEGFLQLARPLVSEESVGAGSVVGR